MSIRVFSPYIYKYVLCVTAGNREQKILRSCNGLYFATARTEDKPSVLPPCFTGALQRWPPRVSLPIRCNGRPRRSLLKTFDAQLRGDLHVQHRSPLHHPEALYAGTLTATLLFIAHNILYSTVIKVACQEFFSPVLSYIQKDFSTWVLTTYCSFNSRSAAICGCFTCSA